jgi:hypothetical protein
MWDRQSTQPQETHTYFTGTRTTKFEIHSTILKKVRITVIFSDCLSSAVSIVTGPSWTTDEMGFHSLQGHEFRLHTIKTDSVIHPSSYQIVMRAFTKPKRSERELTTHLRLERHVRYLRTGTNLS